MYAWNIECKIGPGWMWGQREKRQPDHKCSIFLRNFQFSQRLWRMSDHWTLSLHLAWKKPAQLAALCERPVVRLYEEKRSWATTRWVVHLSKAHLPKTCFYSPRDWGLRAGRPSWKRSPEQCISKADQGCYAPRLYFESLVKQKERRRGHAQEGFESEIIIMADLSKISLIWFIHVP